MIIDLINLVLGACLILWGADKLTDGASSMARRLSVSDLVIGLTVVAMGSSLPEFSVSLFSAIQGSGGMSAGNIVGSNLFNVLAIVGAVAMICPLTVTHRTVFKDIPFTIIASLALMLLCKDHLFGSSTDDVLSRADGLVLVMFFLIFMSYTYSLATAKQDSNNGGTEALENADDSKQSREESSSELMSWRKIILLLLVGFCGLIAGGELLVDSGTSLARQMGVSETVIGLTILAGGTSLPEFAASLIAARKGSSGMAIGNVVGSCLFNIFFVLGVCSSITPMNVADINMVQLITLVGSGAMMWFFSFTRLRITRIEGAIMFASYVAFIAYLISKV